MTRLDKALAQLATLAPLQLREKWLDLETVPAPCVPPPLLRRFLAQRLQEKRCGGLPLMVVRELERVASTSVTVPVPLRRAASLSHGTRLIREWNGRAITVEVTEAGFVWDDRTYRSLSEIARAVTGAHWSGPRFFGINRRG